MSYASFETRFGIYTKFCVDMEFGDNFWCFHVNIRSKVCSGAKTFFSISEQQNAVQKNPRSPRENSGWKVLGVQRSDVFFWFSKYTKCATPFREKDFEVSEKKHTNWYLRPHWGNVSQFSASWFRRLQLSFAPSELAQTIASYFVWRARQKVNVREPARMTLCLLEV